MKAKIKEFSSPDVYDLVNFIPDKVDNFCFYLEISVGVENEIGSEQFGITICTPIWLLENKPNDAILFGRSYLIVFRYNYYKIYEKIKSYIENLNGNSWEDLAWKICRIGIWEFEDYQKW